MRKSLLWLAALTLVACTKGPKADVYTTSEAGDKCAATGQVRFRAVTEPSANALRIYPDDERQVIDGFGGSLTESSAFVLANLPKATKDAILEELFSENGANFSLVRTQIGASDFSVEGKYSLAEKDGDTALESFSLDRDKEGFPKTKYPYIQDETYDLYPLMKDVWAIKQAQCDKTYRIVANTWTAPAWMKDNKLYYQRDAHASRGGALLPEYYSTYADYLIKYIQAYQAEGINIWAITPVNEPMGNDGGWESMDMSPAAEADFIAHYLGPRLEKAGLGEIEILGFDQNTFEMGPYTAAIYGDSEAEPYTDGMAIHWYGSTISCFPEVLDSIHQLYPDKKLLHTEGCIDNLGCPVWGPAIADPEGFTESGWFNNDSFWWKKVATDWAYSTPWWPELHPAYAPAVRYASYIIDGLNHWMTGYIDWNIVLDSIGGPNHVNNFAAAEVMVDYAREEPVIYFTPYYYVLKQFSRSMRPGDVVVRVDAPLKENIHLCAVKKQDGSFAVQLLNTALEPEQLTLALNNYEAEIQLPANSVQTLIIKE